jgi:1,4-dihydroxy-2-naphthoate octaprenyltransferase
MAESGTMMKNNMLKALLLASRPKTLPAAFAPVIIGSAMAFADGRGHSLSAIVAAVAAVLIQIGTNYANDYFDYFSGADSTGRLGPTRATQAGLATPGTMKKAFIITFIIAILFGFYLVYRAGWPVVVIGLSSILFGVLYTTGPFPLGYHGLGDIFVFIFFGLVAVAGSYYVQALRLTAEAVIAGIAPGMLSVAILTVNNLRDITADAKAAKKTLVVRFGAGFGLAEYLACFLCAAIVPIILVLRTGGHFFSLTSILSLALAVPSIKILLSSQPGVIYNRVLADTGKILLLYSILFSIGWML